MNIFKRYKNNESRSFITGAPLILGVDENGDDVVIFVARAHHSNPEYKAEIDRLTQQNQKKIDALKDDTAASNLYVGGLVEDAIRTTCIKSWTTNLLGEDNAPLLFNSKNVEKLWAELPDLVDAIVKFSLDPKNYVGTFDESESLKN